MLFRWYALRVFPALLVAAGLLRPEAMAAGSSSKTLAQIEASPRVQIPGSVRPEATAANDLGPVEDTLPLRHMLLQLKPSLARQAALASYVATLNDKSAANYRQWLTASQFGARFGADPTDVALVQAWLTLHGFTVDANYPSRLLIDFSGTAGQLREAFRTEIHAYDVAGARHLANAANPTIPTALTPVIAGIVSLHDFRPRPQFVGRTHAHLTAGTGAAMAYPVTASDLTVLYNLTPLFQAGYTGRGQTVAVIEDSDLHAAADWTAFRAAFGLSAYTSGALKQIHPAPEAGASNCKDPGAITEWDEESSLDAEYASAAAPGATIEVASCASTSTTSGILLALANVVNSATLPSVMSLSYGNCEAANGATANAAINAAYQQAVAEGISVFVAAGDGGAAFCDAGGTVATHGIGVNAFASTAYNVAVGGTDFTDSYAGTQSMYWSKTNSATGSSAKSYIPESPWNDSCANPLIAAWNGFRLTYGLTGFCSYDFLTTDSYETTEAGGGGPSGCATGEPSASFTVSGTCHGYAKPGWQTATGNPKDGVRDLPDVSLFAADGVWGHAYIFCDSNPNDSDGAPCKTSDVSAWSEGGGTSFAAPFMAGVQAVIAQKWGRQGNPNPVYYRLAAAQFTSATLKTACATTQGAASNAGCIFHDITQGASTVNCGGLLNCFAGVLSTSTLAYAPAYGTAAGWDFATGLGSINAYNLVMNPAW